MISWIFKILFFPIILLRNISAWVVLKIWGWKDIGIKLPDDQKGIIIIAPHTSNWDALWLILYTFVYGPSFPIRGAFKRELKITPLRWLYQAMGGIPISKSKKSITISKRSMADEMADILINMKRGALAILPEGTRALRKNWRRGFYVIAQKAKVPVIISTIDYRKKEIGIRRVFNITGDFEADMKEINKYYVGVTGKYPSKFSLHEPPK